jgi:uncharacterized membrane protein
MTLKQWERRLVNALKGLPKAERERAVEYYREIYGDKLEAGCTEEEILKEFGAPEECAQTILSEGRGEEVVVKPTTGKTGYSVGAVIGLVCMTVLLIIPLYACILAVVAAFASCVAVGAACVLCGGVYTLFSPFFYGANGMSVGGVIAHVGGGIAMAGVGLLLLVGFYLATKYVATAAIKLFKTIYGRRAA